MSGLTVSELAGEVQASPDTLRYYERIGLLPAPPRTASGYRQYGPEAIERVRFIKRAQRFGLRLADIAGLLTIRESGLCPCGGTRVLLEARLAELDDEMAALSRLRSDINAMLAREQPLDDDTDGSSDGPQCRTIGLQICRSRADATATRGPLVPAKRRAGQPETKRLEEDHGHQPRHLRVR